RLLSLIGSWLSRDGPPADRRAGYHCVLAEAYRVLGENETAALNYRAALTFDSDLPQAHNGLATLLRAGGKESTRMIAPLGTYFLERDQPPLSSEEADVVRQFHHLYYHRWLDQRGV